MGHWWLGFAHFAYLIVYNLRSMKVARILIGVLASIFVLLHVIDLPGFLLRSGQFSGGYFVGRCIGKLCAMSIGIFVVYRCFKKKAPE